MQKTLLAIPVALLLSFDLQASEKGFLFNIGEMILKFSGHSYEELEKKIYSYEMNTTRCLNMNSKLKDAIIGREKDIKDCKVQEAYKAAPAERSIGFNILDVLMAGCAGQIKLVKTIYGSSSSPETEHKEEIDTDFVSMYLKDRRSLEIIDSKKDIVKERFINRFEKTIDIKLSKFSYGNKFPTLVLGRIYEINEQKSGGSLGKGVYKFKYNVVQNDKSELEIVIEGDIAEHWLHTPSGEKNIFKLTGTCKSIEEMNKLAETAKE